MRAIILAAGKGTRMGSLTKESPKCMLNFLGKPLIERQIAVLKEEGVTDIVIVTGYMSDKIEFSGCKKVKNERYETTNMVESLFCARDYWADEVIVSYGDIIYERRVLKSLIGSRDTLNVIVDLNGSSYFKDRFGEEFLSETESLVMDDQGNIVDIGEPNPEISRVRGQYIGLMKFNKEGLKAMSKVYDTDREQYRNRRWLRSKNFQNGSMTDMLQRMIDLGHKPKAVCIRSGWLEFDSDKDLHRYSAWSDQKRLDKYYSAVR